MPELVIEVLPQFLNLEFGSSAWFIPKLRSHYFPKSIKLSGGSASADGGGAKGGDKAKDSNKKSYNLPFFGRRPRTLQMQLLFDDAMRPMPEDELPLVFFAMHSLRGFVKYGSNVIDTDRGDAGVRLFAPKQPREFNEIGITRMVRETTEDSYIQRVMEFFRLATSMVGSISYPSGKRIVRRAFNEVSGNTKGTTLEYIQTVVQVTVPSPSVRMVCLISKATVDVLRVYDGKPIRATVDLELTEVTPSMLRQSQSAEQSLPLIAIGSRTQPEKSKIVPVAQADEYRRFVETLDKTNDQTKAK